jgi:Holliday junction resolvase RusA-like endonuclease
VNEHPLSVLPGSVRSKKNSKTATPIGGRNVPRRAIILPSKAYSAWEKEARKVARQKAIIPPLTVPVWIEAHFHYKGRKPDLSGACERIGDCLQGIIYADDGQIYSWDGSRLYHDLTNPRTEVFVRWK